MSSVNPEDVMKLKVALRYFALSLALIVARLFLQVIVFRSVWSWYILPAGYAVPATSLVIGGFLLWSLIDGYASIADAWAMREAKRQGTDLDFLQERIVKGFKDAVIIMVIIWVEAGLIHAVFF